MNQTDKFVVGVAAATISENLTTPTIQAVNLTKVFGERVCVDHLSFKVYAGELYALLGDNGAGKTTTINMLTTLLSPTAGEFFICGYHGLREAEKTKGAFGVVSQDLSIYQELTAYENLAFIADLYGLARKESDYRIKVALLQSGLAERANDKVGEFSTGMQRKLAIAIAMLPEPKVIFMDEPTVGLDPVSRRQIWESLKELKAKGVTILLTTHYLEDAELLADRVGIIRQGKLVIEGTVDELKDRVQTIRSISITLGKSIAQDKLQDALARFQRKFPTQVHYDYFRNTLFFAHPEDTKLITCFEAVIQWLKDEKIPFTKCSSAEPTLEEVFLAIAGGRIEAER